MKIHLLLILFCTSFVLNAQKFSGKATYKSHRKTDIKLDSATIARNPNIQKMMEAKLRQLYQQTYTLQFTQTESVYKQKPKLKSPNPQGQRGGVMVMSFGTGGGNDILYKNLKEQRFANKVELMSKPFLIKDAIPKRDWKMTGNTKTIGKYTVYEATWTREEESINITVNNEKSEEKVSTETRTTTVWYTPEIPISNGPDNWSGLPGLILEVNDGRLTLVCTEVVLNPSEKVDIKEPTKGKVVSQEKYEKISREKTREFMDKSRSRDGRGIRIQMGG